MIDQEKVITALECCKDIHQSGRWASGCISCGYSDKHRPDCFLRLADDAVELLKEQEHSETFIVIDNETGEEANPYNIALYEDWAKHLCYCDMEGWAIEDDGTLLLVDECGRVAYADRKRFKVKWEYD